LGQLLLLRVRVEKFCRVRVQTFQSGDPVQLAITFMAVVGGMIFSLAVALLTEELIFGQVFRLFFSRRTAAVKTEAKR
jgi:hypothetical protein